MYEAYSYYLVNEQKHLSNLTFISGNNRNKIIGRTFANEIISFDGWQKVFDLIDVVFIMIITSNSISSCLQNQFEKLTGDNFMWKLPKNELHKAFILNK